MQFKKTTIFFGIFILFWIVVIGWGMLKTTLKLQTKTPFQAAKEEGAPGTGQEAVQPKGPEGSPQQAKQEVRPILVRVFRARPSNFKDILPVMGNIKGKTEIEIRFEISGVIKNIFFREGEKVKKGDLVACLDPKDAELRLSYAKSKYNAAQAAYNASLKKLEVHQKLYEVGAIIKSKMEEIELEAKSAEYQLETTKSEWNLAENELSKTFYYAPKDCAMGPRDIEEGEFCTPQDKIAVLYEIDEVFVEVGVVERDINKIKAGQIAQVYVDAHPNRVFSGIVDSIYPVVEGKSRTLTAKIKVANTDWLLFPGMFSRVEILIIELENALVIPATTIIPAGNTTLLPVIPTQSLKKDEDEVETGTVRLRKVSLGYITSDYVEILEGLNPNDLVVLEAQGELKDNYPVKIVGLEELSL